MLSLTAAYFDDPEILQILVIKIRLAWKYPPILFLRQQVLWSPFIYWTRISIFFFLTWHNFFFFCTYDSFLGYCSSHLPHTQWVTDKKVSIVCPTKKLSMRCFWTSTLWKERKYIDNSLIRWLIISTNGIRYSEKITNYLCDAYILFNVKMWLALQNKIFFLVLRTDNIICNTLWLVQQQQQRKKPLLRVI